MKKIGYVVRYTYQDGPCTIIRYLGHEGRWVRTIDAARVFGRHGRIEFKVNAPHTITDISILKVRENRSVVEERHYHA